MFGLGTGEMVMIVGALVLLFGANKLPKLGEGLGKSIRSFQRAIGGKDEKSDAPAADDAPAEPPAAAARP